MSAESRCNLGRVEDDGARYCFEHAGFLEAGLQTRRCDRAPELPQGLTNATTAEVWE